MERDGPRGFVLSWARVTYRHYALRRVPGNTSGLPSLFVSVVQPTEGGRVLVGRMSSSTAAPGLWQLPGGSVEPPEGDGMLDEPALRRHATRELVEEIGVDLAPEELHLWVIIRGETRNVGVVFLAPPRPEAELRERFETVVAAERALGGVPELDWIAMVTGPDGVAALEGPHVDYLEPLVRRYGAAALRRST
ncbi:NUDIX domain-containing protein [Actinoallomurus sp. NPDC052274]|uniref:NUDIX domain-containing protein n=1 Tax=Actinoallomurus sp. NPDC052274 TaxID=3155420 RepID=UPI00344677D3